MSEETTPQVLLEMLTEFGLTAPEAAQLFENNPGFVVVLQMSKALYEKSMELEQHLQQIENNVNVVNENVFSIIQFLNQDEECQEQATPAPQAEPSTQ